MPLAPASSDYLLVDGSRAPTAAAGDLPATSCARPPTGAGSFLEPVDYFVVGDPGRSIYGSGAPTSACTTRSAASSPAAAQRRRHGGDGEAGTTPIWSSGSTTSRDMFVRQHDDVGGDRSASGSGPGRGAHASSATTTAPRRRGGRRPRANAALRALPAGDSGPSAALGHPSRDAQGDEGLARASLGRRCSAPAPDRTQTSAATHEQRPYRVDSGEAYFAPAPRLSTCCCGHRRAATDHRVRRSAGRSSASATTASSCSRAAGRQPVRTPPASRPLARARELREYHGRPGHQGARLATN